MANLWGLALVISFCFGRKPSRAVVSNLLCADAPASYIYMHIHIHIHIHTQFTNAAAGNKIQTGGPHATHGRPFGYPSHQREGSWGLRW